MAFTRLFYACNIFSTFHEAATSSLMSSELSLSNIYRDPRKRKTINRGLIPNGAKWRSFFQNSINGNPTCLAPGIETSFQIDSFTTSLLLLLPKPAYFTRSLHNCVLHQRRQATLSKDLQPLRCRTTWRGDLPCHLVGTLTTPH